MAEVGEFKDGELNTTVHVRSEDTTAESVVFGPGDDVPQWAAVQMGAHCFEGGKHPYPASDYPGKPETKQPAKAAPVKAADKSDSK